MSNIIDSIKLSGVTYTIQGSGGGGKAIEGGRGISVTTGETADTVSINLPISASTGTKSIIENSNGNVAGYMSHAEGSGTIANGGYSHAEGSGTIASGQCSHAEGSGTIAGGIYSHAEGSGTIALNESEHASGQYNVSNTGETDADKTLFSVGNGDYTMSHNAFEIRLNGDIYITSGGTDIKLQDNLGGGGGSPTVELTQAQYDAMVTAGTVQADTYYIITDAQAGDLTNYYTKTETNTLLNGKQATLVSGTNIKTINNESILGSGNIDIQGGGGGKAIEAGRGISITTGETADTVSFNLPISAGSQSNSVVVNYNGNSASGWMSFAQGRYTYANNQTESAFGNYNRSSNSSNSFGNSGNTLFTVGNGEGSTTTHNSFEIRQNGDIYIANTNDTSTTNYWEKPMIKLQDALGGGGGGSITIDPSLDSGSTNAVANSAITTAFNSCYGSGTYWNMVGTPRKNIPLRMKKYGTNSYDDVTLNLGSNLVYGSEGFKTLSVSGVVETSAITTAITSSSTDAQVPSAKAVNDKLGGLSVVKLTESEYTALVTKDSNTLYVVVPDPSN